MHVFSVVRKWVLRHLLHFVESEYNRHPSKKVVKRVHFPSSLKKYPEAHCLHMNGWFKETSAQFWKSGNTQLTFPLSSFNPLSGGHVLHLFSDW